MSEKLYIYFGFSDWDVCLYITLSEFVDKQRYYYVLAVAYEVRDGEGPFGCPIHCRPVATASLVSFSARSNTIFLITQLYI
ncbi:MAG: hypothetical protein A2Z28_06795 [Chloroflexi bacterium RBG_16_51_9]|nr:MAG: hypothetical protein A2Z28_06795 [Chloroflexi bacterium RBG_16_51_9]